MNSSFKKKSDVRIGLSTEILEDVVTSHSKKIGNIKGNERIVIDEVLVDGDETWITGELQEEEIN